MKFILTIVLVILLAPVALFIFALVANIFMLATGKITREDLAKSAEKYKTMRKGQKKKRGRSCFCSYSSFPEPIRKALGYPF